MHELADRLLPSVPIATINDHIYAVAGDPTEWITATRSSTEADGEEFNIAEALVAYDHNFWGWTVSGAAASRTLLLAERLRRGEYGVHGLCSFYEHLMGKDPTVWARMEERFGWLLDALRLRYVQRAFC